jgi:alpha-tubulin suppressor-like RCC1 family protein
LALPNRFENIYYPQKSTYFNKNIVDLSIGESHSLALTKDGELLSFGSNLFGQLGRGKFKI